MDDRMKNTFSRLFYINIYLVLTYSISFFSCLDHNQFISRNDWMNLTYSTLVNSLSAIVFTNALLTDSLVIWPNSVKITKSFHSYIINVVHNVKSAIKIKSDLYPFLKVDSLLRYCDSIHSILFLNTVCILISNCCHYRILLPLKK